MKVFCIHKKISVSIIVIAVFAIFVTSCQKPLHVKIKQELARANQEATQLFGYNPHIQIIPTQTPTGTTITMTAHGYGANKNIGHMVAQRAPLTGYIVTFNFPDHDIGQRADSSVMTFGTINELLPLVYTLKTVVAAGAQTVNLYGFSAGGGAIINLLMLLTTPRFDNELERIGITKQHKQSLLKAIEQGVVLLDAPLKSVEEIIALRGSSDQLEQISAQYASNNLRPIDSVLLLNGLKVTIILYFEKEDEIINNRDDAEFISRLKARNAGITRALFGKQGGHVGWHKSLWDEFAKITRS